MKQEPYQPDMRRLPAAISGITQQKRNKSRYSIFIDGEFFLGLSEATLNRFELKEGVEMTPSLYQEIREAEDLQSVRDYLFRILGRRDHSRKELYTKARRKEFDAGKINLILDDFEQKGYIDDRDFARKFARDKANLNRWGPHKIRAALFKKGVSGTDADRAVASAFEEENMGDVYSDLVLKQKRRFLRESDLVKRKKKVFDYLQRKGYRAGDIMRHIDKLMESLEA